MFWKNNNTKTCSHLWNTKPGAEGAMQNKLRFRATVFFGKTLKEKKHKRQGASKKPRTVPGRTRVFRAGPWTVRAGPPKTGFGPTLFEIHGFLHI